MAEREMSGKALLDKLYGGLETMPAVEAELDARDLRRLTDDFLGKPAEPTAPSQHRAPSSPAASKAQSAPRARRLRSPLVVLFALAFAGMITAGVLRESDKRATLSPPPPPVVLASVPPLEVPPMELAPPEPVVLRNPFDATEKFTFPPGTSKADARDQMATLLLNRAMERGAHRPTSAQTRGRAAQA